MTRLPSSSVSQAVSSVVGVGIYHSPAMLPYPPYGKRLAKILSNPDLLKTYSGSSMLGNRGTVWIANGPGAWEWVQSHPKQPAVAFPFDADPVQFRWDFIVGHEPVLLLPPAADLLIVIRHFADALGSWGVSRLVAFGRHNSRVYQVGV